MKALQREHERLGHTADSLRRQLEEKEREAEEMSVITNSETVKHNAVVDDLRSKEQRLAEELRAARKQLSEKESAAAGLGLDVEHARDMAERASQRIGIMEAEIGDLRGHINQLQVEREGLLHTISGLEARVGELKFTAEVQGEENQLVARQLQEQLAQKGLLVQEMELKVTASEREATAQLEEGKF